MLTRPQVVLLETECGCCQDTSYNELLLAAKVCLLWDAIVTERMLITKTPGVKLRASTIYAH